MPRDPGGNAMQVFEPPTALRASGPDAAAAALAEAHFADPMGIDLVWGRLRWHMLGPSEQARWRQFASTGDRSLLLAPAAADSSAFAGYRTDSQTCRSCGREDRRWRVPVLDKSTCSYRHPPVNPGVEWGEDRGAHHE
ncbi:MAG: hypothetical protein JNK25_11445 [Phycisphaerae bacterium]|nr:hypothetical protein [Phycisphaerae bacterium]